MTGAFVYFAFVFASPRFERAVELFDRFLRHGAILEGVAEIKTRFHLRQHQMRAGGSIGVKAAAVERSRGRDPIRTSSGDPQRHGSRETITHHAERATADGFA